MISNRCARKPLVTNCNSIISKSYSRFLVDSNDIKYVSVAVIIFVCGIFFSHFLLKSSNDISTMEQIAVPSGQRINLTLSDGSKIWLNSLTTIKYDPTFKGQNRIVYLDGEAYFEVSKNRDKPFIVKTKSGDVRVLGTKFNVEAYSSRNQFITSLMEGMVLLQSGHKQIVLRPLEKAVWSDNTFNLTQISNLDDYSWRNGLITFTNASFDELMRKFEKHYGYKIRIENSKLNSYSCSGKFRLSDGINYALDVLKENLKFTYERDITDSVITIK